MNPSREIRAAWYELRTQIEKLELIDVNRTREIVYV